MTSLGLGGPALGHSFLRSRHCHIRGTEILGPSLDLVLDPSGLRDHTSGTDLRIEE